MQPPLAYNHQTLAVPSQAPTDGVVRALAAQLSPVLGDTAGNRARSLDALAAAAERGAGLVVLPELCTSGYAFADAAEARAAAEPVDGPSVRAWHEAARAHGLVVVAGLCELDADGALRNSAVVVDPTGVLAVYRKTHLWDREPEIFVPGDLAPPVVDTAAGRIGLAVCFDAAFPEHIRRAALAGAEIVAVPMNSPAPPRPTEPIPIEIAIAMAAANASRVYVVQADRTGEERGVRWAQASVIVDPDGSVDRRPVGRRGAARRRPGPRTRARQVVGRPQRRLRRSPSRAVLPAEHDPPGADTPMSTPTTRGLLERLEDGPVICAEGYLFEFERRGYLQAGAFVPEIVLEQPGARRGPQPRVRPRGLGRRRGVHVLRAPREAADDRQGAPARAAQPRSRSRSRRRWRATPARCSAGNICNTNAFSPDAAGRAAVRAMFEEQVGWMVEAGVDMRRRRDVLLGRGGAHRARRHPRVRAAVGHHAVDPPRARGPRGLDARRRRAGGSPTPGPTSWAELHPRAEDDAAAARRDPRGRRLPRRRAAGPVPHERGRAELPVADRRRLRVRAARRPPVPDRARSAAHATATRSPSSPATPTRSARPTSASAAATRRT